MADVSQLITLGVGTPSDIAHLTLFGLSPTGAVDLGSAPYRRTWVLAERRTTWDVPDRDTTWTLLERKTTWFIPSED